MFQQAFKPAQDFIWRNARLLDRHLFVHLFQHGSAGPIVQAVKAYQNSDGGFGSAIEPDNRGPDGQPIAAEMALRYLAACGALTDPFVQREMLLPLCDWLESVTTAEGGVPFVLPSANAYPHTPWMGTADDYPPAGFNPTASITGFLFMAGVQHPWLVKAASYCWRIIDAAPANDYHSMLTEMFFLENVPDRSRARPALTALVERARQPGMIELDPDAGGYVHKPLDWAAQPSSIFRPLFDQATIKLHLSHLAQRQQPDGGWPITWTTVSPGAELEWRGKVTIEALVTLQAYEYEG